MYNAFKASPDNVVLGLAHSRPRDELKQLDLLDGEEVEKVFRDFKPECRCDLLRRCKTQLTRSRAGRGHTLCC